MNTANKLTLMRVILVPVFMALLLIDGMWFKLGALIVFGIASITDALDGYIARSRNQITTFGKFVDPLADKILTTAAFLCFLVIGIYTPISGLTAIMIILTREFAVSGVRLVAVGEGKVIAASIYGKIKTVSQMLAIVIALILITFCPNATFVPIINEIFLWITVIFTVISGIEYIVKNKDLIKLK
jgi:CDP-diacylglycerol--glycerol-3-phosphate 3-phosphatidyltransferase